MLSFKACFLIGGFTGLVLSHAGLNTLYHDSYYVVGHFHYVLSIAVLIGVLIVLRGLLSVGIETFNRTILALVLFGVQGIFALQHVSGVEGHPRRIFASHEGAQLGNELSNAALLGIPEGLVVSLLVIGNIRSIVMNSNACSNTCYTDTYLYERYVTYHEQ